MVRASGVFLLLTMSSVVFAAEKHFPTRYEIQHDVFSAPVVLENVPLQIQELDARKKSPALAALFSLVIPGLGEHYAGGWTGTGKFFSGLEGLLWLGFAGTDIYGNSLKDDARAFAISHAQVHASGKDDQFYIDIGNFLTTQEFNDRRLQDREVERLYDGNAGFGWRWDSDENRALFRDRRIAGEDVLNNRKFIVTAIVINHLASAINAARLAIGFNKNIDEQIGGLHIEADVMGSVWNPHGVMVTLQKSF